MNAARYSTLYSRFHGCTSFRNERDLIVLDFADMPYDAWSLLHINRFDRLYMDAQSPFVRALKLFFKSEAPVTVVCQNDSWTAFLGASKTVTPMQHDSATFQLYATPYFVQNPASVSDYFTGTTSSDTVFLYKNCVLYLDEQDVPSPGSCYFRSSSSPCPGSLFRLCLLSSEPLEHAMSVAHEWKLRRDVITVPFSTKETIAVPKMIPFHDVEPPYVPEVQAVSTGTIQKRLSMKHPHHLLQDILGSYYRRYLHAHNGKEAEHVLQQLGLIVEWPFRLAFEGTKPTPVRDAKRCVALAVNGHLPKRVLVARYPYEMYTEYQEVPVTMWTPLYYVNTFLECPPDVEKVSVDSTVIGYVYRKAFYCFSFPVLEGRPAPESKRHVDKLFALATLTKDDRILESFRYDHQHSLHRVLQKGLPYHAWCLTPATETESYPSRQRIPELVEGWLSLFQKRMENEVDVKAVQTALTLARHKICFKTTITQRPEDQHIALSDQDIEIKMRQPEIDFINSIRLYSEEEGQCESAASSCVMS